MNKEMIIINLKNVKESVGKRIKKHGNIRTSYIPFVLKSSRINKKLTLREVTHHICSQALLSKIENNLIDSDKKYVPQICETLNLDYTTLKDLENNDYLIKTVYLNILGEYDKMMEINDCSCGDIYIAQDEIIKAYKALYKQDYPKFQAIIKDIDKVKDSLSDFEFFSLLLVMYEFYNRTLQVNKAFTYLDLIEKLNYCDEKTMLYIKECRFILSCKNNDKNINYLYDDIKRNNLVYSTSKEFLFAVYYSMFVSDNDSLEFLDVLEEDYVPKKYESDFKYVKAFVLAKLNHFKDSIDYIKDYETTDIKFAALFAYDLTMIKTNSSDNKILSDEEFKEYRNLLVKYIKLCDQTPGDLFTIRFLRLMQYDIDDEDSKVVLDYIKENLISLLDDFSYPLYNDYIINRYTSLLASLSKYKEAFTYLYNIKNNLK